MEEIFREIKKKSELITMILFYLAAALCLAVYIGNFGGGFLPVMGNLITMILRVAILLVVPVLLSMRKKEEAKIAFLGVSAFWLLTTVFDMLADAGIVRKGATSLAVAMGTFGFLIALALIVTTVFAVLFKWKNSLKWKVLSLGVFCVSLLFFIVFFSLWTAMYADWGFAVWSDYVGFIYSFLIVPVAMLFGAINFWFDGSEVDEFIKQFTQGSVAVKEERKTIVPMADEAGYEDADEFEELEELEPLPPVKPTQEKKPATAPEKKAPVKEPAKKELPDPVKEQEVELEPELEFEPAPVVEVEPLKEQVPAAPVKQEQSEPAEETAPAAAPAKEEATESSPEMQLEEQADEVLQEPDTQEPEEVSFESEEAEPLKQEEKPADEDDDFLKAFAED